MGPRECGSLSSAYSEHLVVTIVDSAASLLGFEPSAAASATSFLRQMAAVEHRLDIGGSIRVALYNADGDQTEPALPPPPPAMAIASLHDRV